LFIPQINSIISRTSQTNPKKIIGPSRICSTDWSNLFRLFLISLFILLEYLIYEKISEGLDQEDNEQEYYQVAFTVNDEKTFMREISAFKNTADVLKIKL
ncbi:MAG: hypothetical protein R6W88_10660, partial [Desulfobacterales bacterium]